MSGWPLAFLVTAAFAGFYYLGYLAGKDKAQMEQEQDNER